MKVHKDESIEYSSPGIILGGPCVTNGSLGCVAIETTQLSKLT